MIAEMLSLVNFLLRKAIFLNQALYPAAEGDLAYLVNTFFSLSCFTENYAFPRISAVNNGLGFERSKPLS
jgi:hypothetical protein